MATRFDTRLVSTMVAADTAPEARSVLLARTAITGVAALIASGEASPRYTRFVDGAEGVPESAVRPDGTIAYKFGYMGEVVAFALAYLKQRSPSRTGRYRKSFIISVNGRPMGEAAFQPASVPDGAEVIVFNDQPYSRKLDVQLLGGHRLRVSVPPGIFDDAARAVGGRFGNAVRARRLYTIAFPGRAATKKGVLIQYPALEIVRR